MKFRATPEQREHLIAGGELVKKKEVIDHYYDNASLDLTRKDWWLRERNGSFELKQALATRGADGVDHYKELEDDASIAEALGLAFDGQAMAKLLEANGYAVFCSCTTKRETYRKGGFTIDCDTALFPEFQYDILEIETMLESDAERPKAAQMIRAFAAEHGLPLTPPLGKILEYLRVVKPVHFQALVDAGITPPIAKA